MRGAFALLRIRLLALTRNRQALWSAVVLPCMFNILTFLLENNNRQPGMPSQPNYVLAIYPPMAFGLATTSFTLQLIQDKEWKCKYVAISQGLAPRAYWAGTFVAHYLTILPVSLVLLGALVFLQPADISPNALPVLVAEALVYPVGVLLFAYNVAALFASAELALKILPICNLLFGTLPTLAVMILLTLPGPGSYADMARVLHVVMSIMNPVYAMPGMLLYLIIPSDSLLSMTDYFTSMCAVPLLCAVPCWLVYGGHLVWRDTRSYTVQAGELQISGDEGKDEDVLAEERRVAGSHANGHTTEEPACYQNLHHTYRTKVNGVWKETTAVHGISLGIRAGECFGLLGPNGAGKTTTLAVLTGEVRPPTAGRVTLFGHDITSATGLAQAYQILGICPQVDPLWETITGRQHLSFYGRVKGVPEAALGNVVASLLHRFGLDDADADKPAGKYSGGMKRKLSLAIALIGNSPLLFLDEPSAAVDAGAKRHLWKVIKMRGRSQTVVLTTHSMEEAEALCNRIAIQVRGQLRCLGTPTHIKHKYGSGYQLELFCQTLGGSFTVNQASREATNVAIQTFVQSRISEDATLLEQHADRYLFQLPPMGGSSKLRLGKVFTELQLLMEEQVGIVDYSLTQPSLEQVFIRFAREQDDAQEGADAVEATNAPVAPLLE